MIIEFRVFSKDYKEKILCCNHSSHHIFEYTCPKCGAKARFHRHGTYSRWITYLSTSGFIVFEPIEILRLKCLSCNSTHSILPGDIIPFQVYTLPVVLFLCEQILLHKNSIRNTANKTKCTIKTIYQKLKILTQSLTLVELYLRQMSLYTAASSISLTQALTFLLLPTMKFPSYFHCHGHPIFLNRRNTITYPLSYAAAFS